MDALSPEAELRPLPWRRGYGPVWELLENVYWCQPEPGVAVLRSLEDGAVRDVFVAPTEVDRERLDGDRLFLAERTGTVSAIDRGDRHVVAATCYDAPLVRFPDRSAVRWLVVIGDRVAEHDTAERDVPTHLGRVEWASRVEPFDVPQRERGEIPPRPPPQVERAAAIERVLREEGGARRATCERLIALELLPASFEMSELRLDAEGENLDAWSDARWVAHLRDVPTLRHARTLADEFFAGIEPWLPHGTRTRVRLQWVPGGKDGVFWSVRRLHAALSRLLAPGVDWSSDGGLWVHRAAWRRAGERGMRVPVGGPRSLEGRRFDGVADSFAPLDALAELGLPLLSFDEEWLALGYRPLTDDLAARTDP